MRTALALFFVLLVSQAWGKSLTTNLVAFECGTGKDRVPIVLKRNEGSWETVTTFGDQANEVLSPDANTFVFPQVDFVQQFLRFKDGTWRLIEVDKGEVTTLSCEEKNKFLEIIAEAIAPLIAEDVVSLRLMQDELLTRLTSLGRDFNDLEKAYSVDEKVWANTLEKNYRLERDLAEAQKIKLGLEKELDDSKSNQASSLELNSTLKAQLSAALYALEKAENEHAGAAELSKAKKQVKDLNQTIISLRHQLANLNELLSSSKEKETESKAQLQKLGKRLNSALARAAAEQRRRLKLEEAERQRLTEKFILQLEKNNLE